MPAKRSTRASASVHQDTSTAAGASSGNAPAAVPAALVQNDANAPSEGLRTRSGRAFNGAAPPHAPKARAPRPPKKESATFAGNAYVYKPRPAAAAAPRKNKNKRKRPLVDEEEAPPKRYFFRKPSPPPPPASQAPAAAPAPTQDDAHTPADAQQTTHSNADASRTNSPASRASDSTTPTSARGSPSSVGTSLSLMEADTSTAPPLPNGSGLDKHPHHNPGSNPAPLAKSRVATDGADRTHAMGKSATALGTVGNANVLRFEEDFEESAIRSTATPEWDEDLIVVKSTRVW